ncbi:hypothetical protein ACFL0V_04200 [Nanoarchaeota archaeon]
MKIAKLASVVLSVLLAILVLAVPAIAQDTCRADFTLSGNLLNEDISDFADLLIEKGHFSVTVYGFSSTEETEVEALARATAVANKLSTLSGNKITAIPQLGLLDSSTDMFGLPHQNQRVIITSTQLFQEEYLPAPVPGEIDNETCPLVLHCAEIKLHKDKWYCQKSESEKPVWYGPCENTGCIGDTKFRVVSSRKQTELNNVIGDDQDSILQASLDKTTEADILIGNGFYLKALLLYQEAVELQTRANQIDPELVTKRNHAFQFATGKSTNPKDAKKVIRISRRASKLTPDHPLDLDPLTMNRLEQIKEVETRERVVTLTIVIVLFILAILFSSHISLHVRRERIIGQNKLLDEAAKNIIVDVERLESSFKKKMLLADDNISKLKSLK